MSILRIIARSMHKVPPRRTIVYLGILTIFAYFIFNFVIPNQVLPGRFKDHYVATAKLAKPSSRFLNPFRPAAHPPPGTSVKESWYSNWSWLGSFSSSVTLDENQFLLPPLTNRSPIYTYYSPILKKDERGVRDAENAILLTWRLAWWAQGFKPIILGSAEAKNNPRYAKLQSMDLDATLKSKITRWLAWETMGSGMLCDYLMLPMGAREDPLLTYLRRGQYPRLTRFENLADGLFAGAQTDITAAVKQALENTELKNAHDFIGAVRPDTFLVQPKQNVLAYYDSQTIAKKYPKVADAIKSDDAKGLRKLNQLIIAHLHSTWQNIFHKGIAVMKPLPNHMSVITEPALTLATFLASCRKSPLPSSCPPNLPDCQPCVASRPLKISTPSTYLNTSSLYTIGTVPHPYTNALLASARHDIDIPWIRRFSERDPWLSALTKDLLGTGVAGHMRVTKFKESVASEYSSPRSLWITAENSLPQDVDWYFGFFVTSNVTSNGQSETPIPGPERRPKIYPDPRDGPVADADTLARERELLMTARNWEEHRSSGYQKYVYRAIEAWNLADTEAWRFVKAFLAREQQERLMWEAEEEKYVGTSGAVRRRRR